MLVPLMPEQRFDAETNTTVPDKHAVSLKIGLINLADYQVDENTVHLYRSLINVCDSFGVDLIDAINKAIKLDIPRYTSVSDYLDYAALMILNSLKPTAEPFDIYTYVGHILYAAHIAFDEARSAATEAPADAPSSDSGSSSDVDAEPIHPIDIDDIKLMETPQE